MSKKIKKLTISDKIRTLDVIGRHFEKYFKLMLFLSSFLLLSELAFCVYWHFDEYSVQEIIKYGDELYLTGHIICLGFSALLIVALVFLKLKKLSYIKFAIILHIYSFVFLTISCLLSILDLKIGLSPISYILACVGIAGIFIIEPIFFTVTSFSHYFTILMFQVVNQYPYFSNQNRFENNLYFISYVLIVILVAFRNHRIIKNEYRIKKQLEKLTYFDELTGLLNERSYLIEIDKIASDIEKEKIEDFAIVMMDLNNLKATNDKYGHRFGCHLVILAGQLLPTLFKSSKLFHVGGDEFIAVVRGEDLEHFEDLMVNFDKEFEYRHELFEDVDLIFSLARGYSVYIKGTRCQDVLQEADSMMYANKKDIKAKYNFTGR